ncbi:MAG: ABC transporter permease [Oscillospiraceae bacterium]|nr:ABC transporter permease [Oscillospiraceae bacterium]
MISLKSFVDRFSRLMLLLLIIAALASLSPPGTFLTVSNFSIVMFQQAPLTMLMGFGMTLAIITKGIDTSMGSVLVLCSMLSAEFIRGGNILMGVVIALVVGALFGLINGLIITRVGVAPFIATFGIGNVALGLAFVYSGGVFVVGFPEVFRQITNGTLLFGIPNIAIVTAAIFVILYFLTSKALFGRRMYACGFNFNATTLSGLNSNNTVTVVYIINGILAATTGLLYMARLNAADPGISGNFTLDSIAAALVGGTSFGGGKGSVAKTVVGALIIVFIRNGMNIMGVHTNWAQAVIGLIILISIALESLAQRISASDSSALQKNAAKVSN